MQKRLHILLMISVLFAPFPVLSQDFAAPMDIDCLSHCLKTQGELPGHSGHDMDERCASNCLDCQHAQVSYIVTANKAPSIVTLNGSLLLEPETHFLSHIPPVENHPPLRIS